MNETYDCSPHPKESVMHKVTRTVHNIFHPHHKQFALLPPMTLSCKVPDMETITIVADAPKDVQFPPEVQTGYPGDEYGIPYGMIYPGSEINLAGRPDNSQPHSSVPEPSALWLLIPAFLFVLLKKRRCLFV